MISPRLATIVAMLSFSEKEMLIVFQSNSSIPTVGFNMKRVQKGHVTLKWYVVVRVDPGHSVAASLD